MKNRSLEEAKVGDYLLVKGGFGHLDKLLRIERMTKTQIILEGDVKVYKSNGNIVGAGSSSFGGGSRYAVFLSDEETKKMQDHIAKRRLVGKLKTRVDALWDKVSEGEEVEVDISQIMDAYTVLSQ